MCRAVNFSSCCTATSNQGGRGVGGETCKTVGFYFTTEPGEAHARQRAYSADYEST